MALAQIIRVELPPVAAGSFQITGYIVIFAFFLAAVRPFKVHVIVLIVRLNMGHEQEEGLFSGPVGKVIDGKVVDTVCTVADEHALVALGIKHAAVIAVEGELQHVADVCSVIYSLVEVMRQRSCRGGKRDCIGKTAGFCGGQAGFQAGTRRAAYGLAGEGVLEPYTFGRQLIEAGRDRKRLAVTAKRIKTLLIGEGKDDVWPFRVMPPS